MRDFRNYDIGGVKMYKSEFNQEFIKKHLDKNPTVIVEFGSYDGGDGVYYKKLFPDAEVYSLEADADRFEVVRANGEIFGLNTYNYAVCEYDGEIEFYSVEDPNVMDHTLKTGSSGSINQRTTLYKNMFPHLKEREGYKVPCTRLDSFCKSQGLKNIDFLHVDVEGAEHRVIQGFGELRPKLVWMETYLGKDYYGENAYVTEDLHQSMTSIGYVVVESTPADTLYKYQQ